MEDTRIVIFASGSGTNAENLIRYFQNSSNIHVGLVVTNNPEAGVIKRAETLGIPVRLIRKKDFANADDVLTLFNQFKINFIVLAGWLLLIPEFLIKRYANKIINIHPALLPKFGGKGMYGKYVHQAVVANNEKESGITIHYVNENYDEGAIIFQKSVVLDPFDTPEQVAEKVQQLEYEYFPKVIEDLLTSC